MGGAICPNVVSRVGGAYNSGVGCLKHQGLDSHPRFFDEQLGSAVGAINYVGGSGN